MLELCCVCMLLPPIIIIMQICSFALNTYGENSRSVRTYFGICGVVCGKLAHSRLGDREDIFATQHIIIIKPEVSTFPIGVIFAVVVCSRWL